MCAVIFYNFLVFVILFRLSQFEFICIPLTVVAPLCLTTVMIGLIIMIILLGGFVREIGAPPHVVSVIAHIPCTVRVLRIVRIV